LGPGYNFQGLGWQVDEVVAENSNDKRKVVGKSFFSAIIFFHNWVR
jgi:hypothetical protein